MKAAPSPIESGDETEAATDALVAALSGGPPPEPCPHPNSQTLWVHVGHLELLSCGLKSYAASNDYYSGGFVPICFLYIVGTP